ncbi:MAG: alpha/beta fold hydrolase [bacterium]|nr:alpha/beta fold hydrolase [bacterium]
MKKAIIIHGWSKFEDWKQLDRPSPSNAAFIPWLSKQLMVRGIHPIAIEMPNSYAPDYEIWKKELERFELDEETILVGWSCGGGFLLRYLSENNIRVRKLVLLAPWIGTFDNDKDRYEFDESFFNFNLNDSIYEKVLEDIILLEAEHEVVEVLMSIEKIKSKLKDANYRIIEGSGRHFFEKNQPAVLEEILRSDK